MKFQNETSPLENEKKCTNGREIQETTEAYPGREVRAARQIRDQQRE